MWELDLLLHSKSSATPSVLTSLPRASGVPQNSKPGTLHELEGALARGKWTFRDPRDQPLEVPIPINWSCLQFLVVLLLACIPPVELPA